MESKSTSGGVVRWGGHVLKTWSSSQSTIALSSGEAELYALTKCAAQTMGLIALANDFGQTLNAMLRTDSTAAIGIVHRNGLGKTRHIRVQYLWIQERIREKDFSVRKIDTKLNMADLLTKNLTAEVMLTHMDHLRIFTSAGTCIEDDQWQE